MAYVVTASKATSIKVACAARLIDPSLQHLVTASSNVLSIHHPQTLRTLYELTCFGRITTITAFRPGNEKLDHIFVTTEDDHYFTVSVIDGEAVTGVTGDFEAIGMLKPEPGPRVVANEQHILVYLHLGVVSILPILRRANPKKRSADDSQLFGPPSTCRFQELKAVDLILLPNAGQATCFGILYSDMSMHMRLKSYEVHVTKDDAELVPGKLVMGPMAVGTNMALNTGNKGILCVGESELYYWREGREVTPALTITPTLFCCRASMGDGFWILGDDYGLLYLMTIEQDGPPKLTQLFSNNEEQSATFSMPAVLVSLNRELFLGSHFGNSQLFSWPGLRLLDKRTSISPVVDLLIESNSHAVGASSLVAACGAYKEGCLRVIKYGVGLNETSEVTIEGVRGLFGLEQNGMIVVTFVSGYIVLKATDASGLEQVDAGHGSIVLASEMGVQIVLVTKDTIKVVKDGNVLHSVPLAGITAAKHFGNLLIVSTSKDLHSFSIDEHAINQNRCDVSTSNETRALAVSEHHIFLSFWDKPNVFIGDHQLSQTMHEGDIESSVGVNSILLHQFSDINMPTLLLGMSDGSLITYQFDAETTSISSRRMVVLGTEPVSLHPFNTGQSRNVFAVSDRSTIIYSSKAKLAYSAVDLPSCNYFTSFVNASLESSVIIATDSGLRIGSIDDVQKLQFRTIKLGELVRRVVETDLVFATISMRLQVDKITGNESQLSFVRLFDKISFKETDEYELETNEACQSLCLHTTADGEQRIVVGTSHQAAEVDQNRRGRIIIFGVNEADKSLWLEAQIEAPGAVYAAASLPRGYLAAGVNSYLRLYNCTGEQIEQTAEFRSNTTVISVSSMDNQIIVGDLMRSITILEMKSGASDAPAELAEFARDYTPLWTTATSFFGAHAYVAGELEGNFVLYAKSDSPLEENELRLDRTGTFKYGEYINKIVPGYIIPPDDEAIVHPRCIFCTVDGSIGIIGEIHADQVNFLVDLQSAISESIDSVGDLSHARWRAFRAGTIRKQGPERFVDGDLLESYLDMDPEAQAAVSKQMNMTTGEIERLIESLARLH